MSPRGAKLTCRTCGTHSNVSYAPVPGMIPGAAGSSRFICGDCLYLEEHPDAAKIAPPARGKAKLKQDEALF